MLTLETLARALIAVGLSIGLILLTLVRVQAVVPVFVSIDWRVLLFAGSLALGISLEAGLDARLDRAPPHDGRRAQTGLTERRASPLATARRAVVGQVALSLGLMVLTGLFARTVQAMVNEAPSALRQRLVATFDPSGLRMTPLEARRFADTLVTGAAADGRVTHVSLSIDDDVRFGLPSAAQTTDRFASLVGTTAAWLDVMEVRLLTGRRLTDAPPSRIITLVIRQALNLVLVGMACGLTLAVPMAFAMQATFVAKVTAIDPMVFLPTISVLLAVGMLAAAIPALRASRIDPIATLRQE